ncbi:hypothetical protein VTL71DRAFT_12379 [Oculimacula yallundae]|uniref:Uncharacterized protein n=1 Tax=Oculimacula yallundae TaxID=86028 RepID=A0ABR4CMW6_9HELO
MTSQANIAQNQGLLGLGLNMLERTLIHVDRHQDPPGPSSQQRVSRAGLRLIDSHFCQQATRDIAPGEILEREVSRWSSDSSECGLKDSAKSSNSDDNELEEEEDTTEETIEEKLERHRRFFQGDPLMRSSQEEEENFQKWMDSIFYDNLMHEVQYGLQETRSQEEIKGYWKAVRDTLGVDDSEDDISPDPVTESLDVFEYAPSYLGSTGTHSDVRGWRRPVHFCPSNGKDLELEEVRKHLTDRK